MSCPTCDHTMAHVSDTVLYCERCGTVKQTVLGNVYVPMLVERCREYEKEATEHELDSVNFRFANRWKRLGIAESINKPEDRPCE